MQQAGSPSSSAPKISFRTNIWIFLPIGSLIAAIMTANFYFLNYIHIFSSILWTGTDIFMAFLLGPILRNKSFNSKRNYYMAYAKDGIFYANYFCSNHYCRILSCFKMGLITMYPPIFYWILAVLVIVTIMMVQGLGILLRINLSLFWN